MKIPPKRLQKNTPCRIVRGKGYLHFGRGILVRRRYNNWCEPKKISMR